MTREQLLAYCASVDGNGSWSDEQCEREGMAPATRGELLAIVTRWRAENETPVAGLTRAEAEETVEAAEQLGALSHLAAHWNMAGWWNESAEWDEADFYALIDESVVDGDHVRSYGPSADDVTCLPEWEGAL